MCRSTGLSTNALIQLRGSVKGGGVSWGTRYILYGLPGPLLIHMGSVFIPNVRQVLVCYMSAFTWLFIQVYTCTDADGSWNVLCSVPWL